MPKTNLLLLIHDKHLAEIYAKKFETVGWHAVRVTTVDQAKKELKKKRISAMIGDEQIEDVELFTVPVLWLVDQLTRERIDLTKKNPLVKLIRIQDVTPTSLIKFIRAIL